MIVAVPAALQPIPASPPIGGPFWTWLVPVLVFAVTFLATWLLYRRFSTQPTGDDGAGG